MLESRATISEASEPYLGAPRNRSILRLRTFEFRAGLAAMVFLEVIAQINGVRVAHARNHIREELQLEW